MSVAVIVTGGKQYKVKVGDVLNVEDLHGQKGEKIVFEDILSGKKVKTSVLGEIKGPKVRICKFKPKTGYRKTLGHRQKYMVIKIEDIS